MGIELNKEYFNIAKDRIENELNNIVYQLYGLTDDEIAIVEGNNE